VSSLAAEGRPGSFSAKQIESRKHNRRLRGTNLLFGLGVGAMRVVTEYRSQAEGCRKLGERTANLDDQLIWELIARAWEKLADLRQRDIEPTNIEA
jgi:hypothetical protein